MSTSNVGAGEFRHVLLTRFNAPLGNVDSSRRLDGAWLRRRMKLFQRWCAPSVAVQQADFVWAVFIDPETPAWVRSRLGAAGATLLPVTAGWRTGPVLLDAGLVDRPWLVTTRLDSDDAIAADLLGRVQRHVEPRDRLLVRFPRGVQVRRGTVYSWTYVHNPFFSVVERGAGTGGVPRTAQSFRHHQVPRDIPVRTVWTRPQWLQVIHAGNVRNRLHGVVRLRGADGLDFGVRLDQPDEPWGRRLSASRRGVRWVVRHPELYDRLRSPRFQR